MFFIMSYFWANLSNKESCTAALDLETSNIVRPKILNLSVILYTVLKFVYAAVMLLSTKLSAMFKI
jgi:hypothetical protein